MRGPRRHHEHLVAGGQPPVDDADVGDDAPVGVVDRVEDQRPRRRVGGALGRRHLRHDDVEQLADPLAGLRADPQHVGGVAADEVGELGGVLVRLRGRQVDLVEDRDDLQVVAQRQVEVRQRLRLDALGGVDEEYGALAGSEAPGHLVGEVDVAGGVDQVEHVGPAVGAGPRQAHGLRLDGDAALALDVHAIEVLRAHRAVVDQAGQLQHPVRQRRLPVVDVGDDAEVADDGRIGAARFRCRAGHLAPIVPCAGPLAGPQAARWPHTAVR